MNFGSHISINIPTKSLTSIYTPPITIYPYNLLIVRYTTKIYCTKIKEHQIYYKLVLLSIFRI